MQIKLVFHPSSGPIGAALQIITESQLGLIPNIGDRVLIDGKRVKITDRCFRFISDEWTDIEFKTAEIA